MRDVPTVAIAVGCDSACAALKVFEDQTVAAGFGFLQFELARDALRRLEDRPALGEKRTLVLLCTQRADQEIPARVAAFSAARPHAEILVHAHAAHWSGQFAVDCLVANARDYFVAGIHDRILARQIGLAASGRPAYGSYTEAIVHGRAFGAMPYTPKHDTDWNSGIVPAMKELKMQPFRSTDELTMSPVPTLVERQIQVSALVIANISRYGSGANANVSQEIGHARALGKPCLIVQQCDEKKIDTNLRGLQLLRYHSCADLAVQLYVALRECIRDPDPPCEK
jgi:hypothetical protein